MKLTTINKRAFQSKRFLLTAALLIIAFMASARAVMAQAPPSYEVFQPLSQHQPPGMASQWAQRLGRHLPTYFQPVQINLPTTGIALFYQGNMNNLQSVDSGTNVGLAVGQSYRFRISNMPEYPGVELYPSIEVIDHLHPPYGQRFEFPIPLHFTNEEIELAITGRLVTRVVYLEQPNLAAPVDAQSPDEIRTVEPSVNLLKEADIVGRPMLIMRLGSRTPSPHGFDRGFYGSLPPIELPPKLAAKVSQSRTNGIQPVIKRGVRYTETYLGRQPPPLANSGLPAPLTKHIIR